MAIVTNEHLNLSTAFEASHFLIAKVSPEQRLKPGFRTQKKCPFPLNGGVPSVEVTKDYVNIFAGPNFVSPERGYVSIE